MAGGARRLPKWQAVANLVPNTPSKYYAKKDIFSIYFFLLTIKFGGVESRYRKQEERK